MAEKTTDLMERIVSLCKRRGFVFQSSEIYGGINSCYDYGPLGAELKRNVKEAWWRAMVTLRDDIVGLDSAIIQHPEVWRSSGHVAGFSDIEIDRVRTADLDLPAPRPRWSVLDCSKAEARGVGLRNWQEAVREYLESDLSPLAGQGVAQ